MISMNKNLIRIKSKLSDFNKTYLLCLLIVCLFGFYKNFYILLQMNYNFKIIISKLLFVILGFSVGFAYDSFKNKSISLNFNAIIGLISGMIIPFNTKLIYFLIGLSFIILIDLIDKNNQLNKICIIKSLIIILLIIFGNYSYQTPLEATNEYAYSLVDNFIGNQIGGIFSTSVLLILTSLIILGLNK